MAVARKSNESKRLEQLAEKWAGIASRMTGQEVKAFRPESGVDGIAFDIFGSVVVVRSVQDEFSLAMGLAQAIRRKQRVMIRAINRFDVIGFRVGRERSVDDALVESVLREITML